MKTARKKKKSIFLRVALVAFSVYVIVMLVQLQMDIGKKQKQIDNLQNDIDIYRSMNEDIQNQSDNFEIYLEQEARDQNMAKPGEIVFKEIPGK